MHGSETQSACPCHPDETVSARCTCSERQKCCQKARRAEARRSGSADKPAPIVVTVSQFIPRSTPTVPLLPLRPHRPQAQSTLAPQAPCSGSSEERHLAGKRRQELALCALLHLEGSVLRPESRQFRAVGHILVRELLDCAQPEHEHLSRARGDSRERVGGGVVGAAERKFE